MTSNACTQTLRLLAAAAALALVGTAHAADPKDLVKKNGCFTCHAMSGTKVGPGFADISAKFAGKGDAVSVLANAIQHGESGTFGPGQMPPSPNVSADDAKAIAAWIVGLKK